MTTETDPVVVCAGGVVADHTSTPIDHAPAAGELVAADELLLTLGGSACNTSVDLVRLGLRASLCAKVGNDVFGRIVADELRAAGVDTRFLHIDPRHATSQTLIVNVRGQDRRFVHSFGANRALVAADLDPALDSNPKVLYVGGYLILPALDPGELAERFRRARSRGVTTVLDVATPGPADYLSKLRVLLPETDVFLPNTDEAALILGETDATRQALAFRDLGARRVVVTMGGAGSVSVSDAMRVRLGAYPVEFVDGTGGGDAFDAGYIAGLVDGLDEAATLKLASAVGASCVRALGTSAGVFTRAQADAFVAAHPLPIESF